MANAQWNAPAPDSLIRISIIRVSFVILHSSLTIRISLLLLALAQARQHAEIIERRGVAPDFRASSDLFEQAPHDFSGTGLRQRLGETDVVRLGDRPDLLGHMLAQLVAQLGHGFYSRLQRHERHQRLALQFVRPAHHRGFGHVGVADQGALDLSRADPVPRDVEHVVDPADNPEVTVLVLPAPVSGEITTFDFAPIDLFVTLRVAPDAAQHVRPRLADDQLSAGIARNSLALVVHDFGHDPEKWQGGGTRFGWDRPRQGRDHDAAGLRLPPGIDNGTTFGADDFLIPNPSLGINRLADGAQQPE